jgi:secondary thiamine-phosphate synthase enzyme
MIKHKIINIETKGNCDILDITNIVEKEVESSKVKDGICSVFVKGSTAAISTIEFEKGLLQDFKNFMDKILPKANYEHNKAWGDENGHSHLRSTLLKSSIQIPIINNKLFLGSWQQIVLIDFDTRPRKREIVISIYS